MQDYKGINMCQKKRVASRETLTCNASEELSGKTLNLTVRERHKVVALEKVEDTLSEQVGDDADMTSIIETVSKMDTPVSVFGVICFECR